MNTPATRAIEAWSLIAVAVGGAVGAVLRWALGELVPDGAGFPWTTFAINVSGSFALALLPALAAVRSRHLLVVGLGPGLLGGYTTLSAYTEQTRGLLDEGRAGLAAAYAVGTLAACLVGVAAATRMSSAADRWRFSSVGGEE